MKGIILAGGNGSRLEPITTSVCKQLLPVYDKPMIYYPLYTLISGCVDDVLIIGKQEDIPSFQKLFGDGSRLGIKISYETQAEPNGIAEAFLIGEKFISKQKVALVLGDNIFCSSGLSRKIERSFNRVGGTVFAYEVKDPSRFGVIVRNGIQVLDIEEKPLNPQSREVSIGLYIYDDQVVEFAKRLKPSKRGELEITDLNKVYIQDSFLHCEVLERGSIWLDTGTTESLADSTEFVKVVRNRQGVSFGCLEEIALSNGFISKEYLLEQSKNWPDSDYYNYARSILEGQGSK